MYDEEELMEKMEELLKNGIKKLEEENKEAIKLFKREYEEKLRKMERTWEEKQQAKLEEMENRYIDTFRNLEENRQQDAENRRTETCRAPTTDITKPLFYGNRRDTHPIDFLSRLEEYFALKQIVHNEEKQIIAGDCLRNAANNWFSTIRFQIDNYRGFRHTFLEEYWSREIQIQTWSQCLSVRQVQPDINYREHFSYWATKLRHLEVPKLSEAEIVKNIANHYPGYLRAILISLPECTILNAMKILGTEEHRRPARDNNNRGNQQNSPRENNNDPRQEPQRNNQYRREQQSTNSYPDNRNNHNNDRQRREPAQNNQQSWRG